MRLFTSESVTAGHPDKVCDQISDTILDAHLQGDPAAHVAVEVFASSRSITIGGEVSSTASVDVESVTRDVLRRIGYTDPDFGVDADTVLIRDELTTQSAEIAAGVADSYEHRSSSTDVLDLQGAGDQGLMFGYACIETPELMPAPIVLAHRITDRLTRARTQGILPWLRPDGKAQVTLRYCGARPVAVDTVLVSTQHAPHTRPEAIDFDVIEEVIQPVLAESGLHLTPARYLVNPSGRFVLGGPAADTGLTGRKIIVDTYGGAARHGGGAFSGKDPSKVDRSAAYAARWVAKHVVTAGLAERCEIQVAYAIGAARPVGIYVETFGTSTVPETRITAAIRDIFDLRPAAIIRDLNLLRPIYAQTATGGHFGRPEFPWEQTPYIEELLHHVA